MPARSSSVSESRWARRDSRRSRRRASSAWPNNCGADCGGLCQTNRTLWETSTVIELPRQAGRGKVLDRSYDYVIVGAGSAGCVVARCLLDGTDATVLLLEAGGSDEGVQSLSNPPQWVENLGSRYDWAYRYEPRPHVDHRSIPLALGKMLGGSGSINGMLWARGHRADYKSRSELGVPDLMFVPPRVALFSATIAAQYPIPPNGFSILPCRRHASAWWADCCRGRPASGRFRASNGSGCHRP
jgi:hypothetical protein